MRRNYYLFVDPMRLACIWVIVEGWIDEGKSDKDARYLCGTVICRGPDIKRGETEPVAERSGGHQYRLGLDGTSWLNLSQEFGLQWRGQ